MPAIREWVRDLVVLTLVAGMLEFLVPNSSMKGYVRTVMGLLVMLAMLGPVLALLGRPVAVDPAAVGLPEAAAALDLERVQRDAARLAEIGAARAGATFRARLAAAARAAAAAVPGVIRAEAAAVLGAAPPGGGAPPVAAVHVRVWTAAGTGAEQVLPAVQAAVAGQLGLAPDLVQVRAVVAAEVTGGPPAAGPPVAEGGNADER